MSPSDVDVAWHAHGTDHSNVRRSLIHVWLEFEFMVETMMMMRFQTAGRTHHPILQQSQQSGVLVEVDWNKTIFKGHTGTILFVLQ